MVLGGVKFLDPSPGLRMLASLAPVASCDMKFAGDMASRNVCEDAWRAQPVSVKVGGMSATFRTAAGRRAALGGMHTLVRMGKLREAAVMCAAAALIFPGGSEQVVESLGWKAFFGVDGKGERVVEIAPSIRVTVCAPSAIILPPSPLSSPAELRKYYAGLREGGLKHTEAMGLAAASVLAPPHSSVFDPASPHAPHMHHLLDYLEFLETIDVAHRETGATALPLTGEGASRFFAACYAGVCGAAAAAARDKWLPRGPPDIWSSADGRWFGLNRYRDQERSMARAVEGRAGTAWLVLADAGVGKTCAMADIVRGACLRTHDLPAPFAATTDLSRNRGVLLTAKTHQAKKQLEAAIAHLLSDLDPAHLDVTFSTLDKIAVAGGVPAREAPLLPFAFTIVDEVSMAEYGLVEAVLRDNPSSHVLFIGDEKQLPSVGVGDVVDLLRHVLPAENILNFDDVFQPRLPPSFVPRHPPSVRGFFRSVFERGGWLHEGAGGGDHVSFSEVPPWPGADAVPDDVLRRMAGRGASTDTRVVTFTNRTCNNIHTQFARLWAEANGRQLWKVAFSGAENVLCEGMAVLASKTTALKVEEVTDPHELLRKPADRKNCVMLDTFERVVIASVLQYLDGVPVLLEGEVRKGERRASFTFRPRIDGKGVVNLKQFKPASCVTVHACQGTTVRDDYVVTLPGWYGGRGVDRRFVYTALTRGRGCRCVVLYERAALHWVSANPYARPSATVVFNDATNAE